MLQHIQSHLIDTDHFNPLWCTSLLEIKGSPSALLLSASSCSLLSLVCADSMIKSSLRPMGGGMRLLCGPPSSTDAI